MRMNTVSQKSSSRNRKKDKMEESRGPSSELCSANISVNKYDKSSRSMSMIREETSGSQRSDLRTRVENGVKNSLSGVYSPHHRFYGLHSTKVDRVHRDWMELQCNETGRFLDI
jgi:hypothetical protein